VSTFWIIWLGIAVIVTAVFIYRFTRPDIGTKQRGTKPGQGDTVVEGGAWANFDGGGSHQSVTRVTRDPKKYAETFCTKDTAD